MAELCFKVPHLADGEAVKAITAAVRQVDGIAGVEIDPHTGWVVVTGDRIDTDAIRGAVGSAGYEAEL